MPLGTLPSRGASRASSPEAYRNPTTTNGRPPFPPGRRQLHHGHFFSSCLSPPVSSSCISPHSFDVYSVTIIIHLYDAYFSHSLTVFKDFFTTTLSQPRYNYDTVPTCSDTKTDLIMQSTSEKNNVISFSSTSSTAEPSQASFARAVRLSRQRDSFFNLASKRRV